MAKARNVILLIVLILVVDQVLKIWVKTNMPLSYHWDATHVPITPYDRGIRPFGENAEWAQIYFVENEGMAWGWKFGGEWGKMALTLFRMLAVIFGVWYIREILRKKHSTGFIVCVALIFAGAFGNLIDSMFYGLIFEESTYTSVAKMFPEKGYAGFLHGKVVDMFYFPIIRSHYPSWFPIVGGDDFEFFSPVFNIADASISAGVIALLVFQKRFLEPEADTTRKTIETNTRVNDDVQVS
ncbi:MULTISPECIES: lipoprotein signal peptidase [unclassified Flavihumibacter]|uniref:lipoprotein signal peptidase n=1 Tax=unclassified Flavihumibacter TaxID=2621068 RepID=UPI00057ED25C|nr:lipoprotein signal peptidase [Flavihumibacter sp. ZG627]KIC89211.1 peptidase A8 [Flavihumibacter sp. ZG627]MCG7857511.1 lipoprotein signal peptidase [Flavihumibacter sediminis]